MATLRQILEAVNCSRPLLRTLRNIEFEYDKRLMPRFSVGNTAVILRAKRAGRSCAVRCFVRPTPHRREIYGERLHERELYIPSCGEWTDIVLSEWIEGETLHTATLSAAAKADRETLASLSRKFDALAAELTSDNWAHGDLKPENIILTPRGELQLIDFDAMFLPAFSGEESPELGTAAFQHPRRTAADFDARLDDYPAAVISTTLAALALDPQLAELYRHNEGTLFESCPTAKSGEYKRVLEMFERCGDAVHYRTAQLLLHHNHRIPQIAVILGYANLAPTLGSATPELFVEAGLWGYRTSDGIISPPLWDCGFDFSESLAAVQLGHSWHYIDPCGRIAASFPECDALKPFRNNRGEVIRCGERRTLRRKGGGIC